MFITIHGKILILCKVPAVEDSYNLGSSATSLLRHLNHGPPQRRSVLDSGVISLLFNHYKSTLFLQDTSISTNVSL